MKYLIGIILVIGAFFTFRYFTADNMPSTKGLAEKIKTYVEATPCSNNGGTNTLSYLDNVSLGDFSKEFGGWPVYANYETVCNDNGNTTTYNGRNNANKKIAMVFVRKTSSGNLEIFVPQVFQQVGAEMQQEFDKFFK